MCSLAADLTEHHVVLDGEVVALNKSDVLIFNAMQSRNCATSIGFWMFD
ncbi:hypothetical protein [Mycobacterium lepromatosis]|nr:hypothetical protein [Mycobacterium lepromatosis]